MILQEKLGIENFSRGKMKKNCIRKLFKVNFKEAYCQKKIAGQKRVEDKKF